MRFSSRLRCVEHEWCRTVTRTASVVDADELLSLGMTVFEIPVIWRWIDNGLCSLDRDGLAKKGPGVVKLFHLNPCAAGRQVCSLGWRL